VSWRCCRRVFPADFSEVLANPDEGASLGADRLTLRLLLPMWLPIPPQIIVWRVPIVLKKWWARLGLNQ
jgi:hypothetical protein